MPEGIWNFALAAVILALKLMLLPRLLLMPGMLTYLSASAAETACYLLGWPSAGLSAIVSVLAGVSAVEAPGWVLGIQSDLERTAVRRWCFLLGLVFCASQFAGDPVAYPRYPKLIYEIRLTASVFGIGYLVALLGYCFAGGIGIPKYVGHASILLLRLATFGGLLLIHDRAAWFAADLAGETVNVLTLSAWLWLLSPRLTVKPSVQRLDNLL